MDCQRVACLRARQVAKIATVICIWISVFVVLVDVARAEMPAAQVRQVLARAMDYQMQFRAGNVQVVPEYVALLEAAVKAQPDNADLWYALGRAYLMECVRQMLPGGNAADAARVFPSAMAALQRALAINPDHPTALAQLGAVQALLASQTHAPELAAASVARMNRAVELAPQSTMVRLVRAFLGLNLPEALRNHTAEAADLDFLIETADWSRAGDYVRIMRGDLSVEQGDAEQARAQYRIVADSETSGATDVARARLAALNSGGVSMSDIKALRTAAGAQCTMCHGK
jgi:tetratricopeptide (TPR) repeat protein